MSKRICVWGGGGASHQISGDLREYICVNLDTNVILLQMYLLFIILGNIFTQTHLFLPRKFENNCKH